MHGGGYGSLYGGGGMRASTTPSQNKGYTFDAAGFDQSQYGIVTNTNVNLDYRREVYTLSAKAWDAYNNEGVSRAIYETLEQLTFGEVGLNFRSGYTDPNMDEQQQMLIRGQINTAVKSASKGTRLDAGNQLTRLQLEKALNLAAFNNGDAFAVRVTKTRPGDQWSTTVRIVDAWRLVNPVGIKDFVRDSNKNYWFQGIRYNSGGEPLEINYITNPNIGLNPDESHEVKKEDLSRVKWFTDSGMPNIIHKFRPSRADQLRGFPEPSHILKQLKFLNSVNNSYIKAKAAQAADVKYVQTNDPDLYAAYQKSNAQFGPNYKQNEANVAAVGPDSQIILPDLNFNGADYQQFVDSQLRTACSSYNLPFQLVMNRFGQANMAVSRTELDQAHRTGTVRQNGQIDQVTSIFDWWILDEAIKRGRVRISSITRAREGSYDRPAIWSTDPSRDAKADTENIKQGYSLSTVYARRGQNFEDEARKRAENIAFLDKLGLSIDDMSLNDDDPEDENPNSVEPGA